MSSRKLVSSVVVGAAVIVAAASYGIASATSGGGSAAAGASPPAASGGLAGGHGPGGTGSNARSGPASGGAAGTVSSASSSRFTLSTSAAQKVTVTETSATIYQRGTRPTSASAVRAGEPVLVLGMTSGTIIKATEVIVQPNAGPGSATSSAPRVIPFQRGAPTTSKQVGQIPANWSQGSGTIISGAAADKATEAALAAYPGGIVDRVVKLSNGDYNVHYIGVNWPHHVFVSQDFKVIGAE
jgi:hypothetical protein